MLNTRRRSKIKKNLKKRCQGMGGESKEDDQRAITEKENSI